MSTKPKRDVGTEPMKQEELNKDLDRLRRTMDRDAKRRLGYYDWVDEVDPNKTLDEALDEDLEKLMTEGLDPEP